MECLFPINLVCLCWGCQQIIYERTFLDLFEWLTGRRDLHTHSTNIWFSTSFEYFEIPLLHRCWITPCMRRRRRVFFLRCKAFFHNVFHTAGRFFVVYFVLQGVFSQSFFAIGRVYIACFRCKSFFTTFFTLQGVFRCAFCAMSRFLLRVFAARRFLRCAFCAMSRFSLCIRVRFYCLTMFSKE